MAGLYGKTFGEIFAKFPPQYKVMTIIGAVFIIYVIIYTPMSLYGMLRKEPKPSEISLQNKPAELNSVFDPSVTHNPKTGNVVMAYTASPANSTMRHVRLADTSASKCSFWNYQSVGFEGKSYSLLKTDAQTLFRDGVWRIETPTIVYDPDDTGKEWKLFAYKYFWSPSDTIDDAINIAKHYGMVVYKYAPSLNGEWSTEQWLFSPAPNYPPPPYQHMVKNHLNNLHPALSDVSSYSRPSVIYKDGYLLMSLSAYTDKDTPNRVVMLASPDHGQSWLYLGAPITEADAASMGDYTRLAGATLMQRKGDIYLSAVLGDEAVRTIKNYVFKFTDLNKAKLRRKRNNHLEVINEIDYTQPELKSLGGGFATYTEACDSGFFTAEQRVDGVGFGIFSSNQSPVRK